MKKTLLFLSYSAFSQVFQLDTTFKFQPVKKQYNAIYPIVNPLSDTLLNIVYEGNIYHNKPVISGNLLVNKDGRLVRALTPTATPYFDFRNQYSLITPEGKYYRVQMKGYGYMLQRFNQAGNIDTTFNFPIQKDAILQCFLLHNGNLLVNVPNATPASAAYQIIDGTGKLIRGFSLTDYGFSAKAWLKSVAFNESGEYYLYIYLNEEPRVAEVIKTNKDLVRDNTFQKTTVSPALYDVSKSKIGVYKNSIYLYSANPDETKNSIEKYDNTGKKIWQADFGRISGYYSTGPTFYHQQDESLALIYMDNKHLRIKADGKVDSVFYQNKTQLETAFLHAFDDGSYWVMRNKSGLIEKMYADGNVDANFKISTQLEKTLVPNRIEKQTNNYLVELIDLPSFANSPYSFRIPINATCIRVYNQQHQLLYDFFDSKTIWQTYKTKDALIIRGDGKFYTIDSKSAITTSADTLQTNDVIDWENLYIYRLLSDNLLARYKIGVGRDESFRIDLYDGLRIYNFQLLSNGKIAVQGADNSNTLSFFLYNNASLQERPTHTLDYHSSSSNGNHTVVSIKDGYLIHRWLYGGIGNINQSFVKFKNDYTVDTTYKNHNINGGQFVRYMNDGTVFLNTVVIIPPNRKSESYNFFKLLPSGKVDSSFILSDLYYTYGFEFFDDHTLYAVGDKGLFRFIKSAEKRYFYYNPLPEKMPVNSGNSILSFKTNIKPIKVEVTGNATLQNDSSIAFLPKTGMVSITFRDENDKILAHQQIELIKTIPYFTYTHPNLFDSSPPYEFKAQSSSGLPVKINAYGKEFIGSMPIDLSMGPYVKINLKSEGNEQYETIEETLYFVIQSPLSEEPVLIEKDLVCYPNPTIDELYIKINNFSINSFRLVNVKGNEIPVKAEMIGDQYKLSFANIPQGIYILLAQSGQIQVSRKIVIE